MGNVAPVWGSRCQSFSCLYSTGSVDVTGSYAEDTTMTLHQDFSATVLARESTHGGFVDVDQDDKSSIGKQMIR